MKIARIRNDFLHKTSTTIGKTHALVVLEDLSVKSMSRSGRGTVNAPGRNVRAKAGLDHHPPAPGLHVLELPLCGHVSAENRKTQAVFRCVLCGHAADGSGRF